MSLIIDNTNQEDIIHTINFNQNSTCLCIGINKGFKIFNTQPFREHIERYVDAELSLIEMFQRSNLIAFVSNETSHKYGSNKVIIWDDYQIKVLLELRFNDKILNIKLKKDLIYVVFESQIQIFNYSTMTCIQTLPTYINNLGCFSISHDPTIDVISYPESSLGYIMIKNMTLKQSFLIPAHDSVISNIKVSYKGEFVATFSIQGTILRIFDASSGVFLQELRRGSDNCTIYSVSFSLDCKFIVCSSSKNTIHIFSLRQAYLKKNELHFMDELQNENITSNKNLLKDKIVIIEEELNYYKTLPKNQKSLLYNLSGLIPLPKYFTNEWSFAQLRIKDINSLHKVCFSMDNDLYVFCLDGRFFHARFDKEKGGECEILFENNIFFKS